MRKIEPIKLANSEQKSYSYFRHARWEGKRRCPDAHTSICTIL